MFAEKTKNKFIADVIDIMDRQARTFPKKPELSISTCASELTRWKGWKNVSGSSRIETLLEDAGFTLVRVPDKTNPGYTLKTLVTL